jgi:hypothetical protein
MSNLSRTKVYNINYRNRKVAYLDSLHGGTQTLLQLGQLAAKVGVVSHQLLMHLGQLVEVVLQEADLLLLC